MNLKFQDTTKNDWYFKEAKEKLLRVSFDEFGVGVVVGEEH